MTQNAARRYAEDFLENMRKQTTWTEPWWITLGFLLFLLRDELILYGDLMMILNGMY